MKSHPWAVISLAAVAAFAAFTSPEAIARKGTLVDIIDNGYEDHHSYQLPAAGALEVAFSPSEGSEALVIKVIDSARSELRVLAYSFTNAPVVAALLRAKKRGVDVQIVADYKSNMVDDRSGKPRAALSALANAGVSVQVISVYRASHDKVIIADKETVELGSFNYSDAAAHKNSENVLVNWKNPKLAAVYLDHFDRNQRQATPYALQY